MYAAVSCQLSAGSVRRASGDAAPRRRDGEPTSQVVNITCALRYQLTSTIHTVKCFAERERLSLKITFQLEILINYSLTPYDFFSLIFELRINSYYISINIAIFGYITITKINIYNWINEHSKLLIPKS